MNVGLLLGSGRIRTPGRLSTLEPITQVTASSVPENEIDVLNTRLDLKQINFTEYLETLIAKEYI